MGFRFRKSAKLGPLKVNFSKSGVGYSVGGKGFRFTKKANGGYRTTASIPGSGISYTKDYSDHSALRAKNTQSDSEIETYNFDETPRRTKKPSIMRIILAVILVYAVGRLVYSALALINAPRITELTLSCEQNIELDISRTAKIPIIIKETGANTSSINYSCSDNSVLQFAPVKTENDLFGQIVPLSEGEAYIHVSNKKIQSNIVHVTIIDSERIAAEEAARKEAEEQAALNSAEFEKNIDNATKYTNSNSITYDPMVWISTGGTKYHNKSSCSNMENPTQITLSSAKSQGYSACKKCH